ncbi:hypothetical protein D0Q02_03450 [Micromonospora craniellae]|uniref:Uncharacterized protein n=1 Tax=Micromonospora craniellae TaxID=2294034 RepID=A0A372G4E4_9ACTN|nr:hypothetical protein D0Q02_03450 [Micromonospora craniellae]
MLLDADDHCPADLGPRLLGRAQAARANTKVGVVLPKVDQAPLAAKFDLHAARANSSSFDKLWREVQNLLLIEWHTVQVSRPPT